MPPPQPSSPMPGKRTYIPPRIQKAMAKRMEQSMPTSMKKYAESYVQQGAVAPQTSPTYPGGETAPGFTPHAPAVNLQPQSHFHPTATSPPVAPTPPPAPVDPQPILPEHEYDFITEAVKPPRQASLPKLPGVSSTAMRAIVFGGGLLVLIIVFSIVKGLLSGSSDLTSFVSVAQDQQELIHLATNASQQQNLTVTNQNFSATAQLSLTSSQSAIASYLLANGKKVNLKTISLKVSTATDTQLVNAAAATTYDQTYQEIMKTKLTTYISDIQLGYQKAPGQKGRALLKDTYNQAQLLLSQLNDAPAND